MSSAITGVVQFMTIACDMLNAIDSVHKMYEERNQGRDGLIQTASTINRLVLLGFTAVEAGMLFKGSKSETLALLKKCEMIPRFVQWPLQIITESNPVGNEGDVDMVKIVFRGVLAPLADICRVLCEGTKYQAQTYLEQSRADPSFQAPVYCRIPGQEGGAIELTGYRTVNSKECEQQIENAAISAAICVGIRSISGQVAVANYPERRGAIVYPQLQLFLNNLQNPPGNSEWEDLGALQRIPLPLHEDVVLGRYICPITNEPIRDPVRDPNGTTLYERSAIYNWLNAGHRVSPVTRVPLDETDLQEVPAIRAVIDARLRWHQENLIRFLQESGNLPENARLNHEGAHVEPPGT